MSLKRKFELVDVAATVSESEIDWSICFICQRSSSEKLQCPSNSTLKDKSTGYRTLANDLQTMSELQILPCGLNLEKLQADCDSLLDALIKNEGKFHKSCRNLCDKQHIERALKRKQRSDADEGGSSKFEQKGTRSSYASENFAQSKCFFCDEVDLDGNLHTASTMGFDTFLRSAAKKLSDDKLLAKLSQGDIVAIEAKYHKKCLTSLHNRYRDKTKQETEIERNNQMVYGIGLMEIIGYIRTTKSQAKNAPIFKLSDIKKLFIQYMERFGVFPENVHSTRLKEQILGHVPELQAHRKGKDILLSFKDDSGEALFDACYRDSISDGMCLVRAAEIIRKDLFSEFPAFQGNFTEEYIKTSIPASLLFLVRQLLEGIDVDEDIVEGNTSINDAPLTIGQLIRFNATKRQRTAKHKRHRVEHETPLPVYLGLMISAKTGKSGIIDRLAKMGLSITSDRVDNIKAGITRDISTEYTTKNIVCPTSLCEGVFTSAAIDNIDHNSTSSTAQKHFHGTGISLFQHHDQKIVSPCPSFDLSAADTGSYTAKLPDYYTDILPVKNEKSYRPISFVKLEEMNTPLHKAVDESKDWLQSIEKMDFLGEKDDENVKVSWSAFHQEDERAVKLPKGTSVLLPLINENINSQAVVKHTMQIIQKAVNKVNPGQIPVITADQPIYALGKQVQWQYHNNFGQDKFIFMLGSLHTEMAMLSTIGDWLLGSEWSDMLVEANIVTCGTANAILSASHVKRSRYAHQVSLATLDLQLKEAFQKRREDHPQQSIEDWITSRRSISTQFQYWYTVYELEALVLMFVKSIRLANFGMFIDALEQFVPWMFALDHVHYAQWLSVFIFDLKELPVRHPEIHQEFVKGKFTFQKTNRKFSSMAVDQAHEQNNRLIKDDGGATSIFQNSKALMKWMVAGPDIARLVMDFDAMVNENTDAEPSGDHHENTVMYEKRFRKDVKALTEVFAKESNPFEEEEDILLTLISKTVMSGDAKESVKQGKSKGVCQYNDFIGERLITGKKSIHETIKRNNLQLFRKKNSASSDKKKLETLSLKQDRNLYASLYVACQTRQCSLEEFFAHENHKFPSALSQYGQLRHTAKSDSMKIITKIADSDYEEPQVTATIFDGAAIVQMLKPRSSKSFGDYCKEEFTSFLASRLRSNDALSRIDIVFDVYRKKSMKALERDKRGAGCRLKVTESTPIAKNWQNFLRVNENKMELFRLLAKVCIKQESLRNGEIVFSYDDKVVVNRNEIMTDQLSPCNHEEADTRMFLHAKHLANLGHQRVIIKTVDTDVVIIAISLFPYIGLAELWIEYGVGKDRKWLPIHRYSSELDEKMREGLMYWYAYTGCDTVSSFAGRGKISTWNTWKAFPEVTDTFIALSNNPEEITKEQIDALQRYTVLLYDRSSSCSTVNEARRWLFTKRSRSVEGIPPTEDALVQHVKRAALQAGHIWRQAIHPELRLPDLEKWGWRDTEDGFSPIWITSPEASKALKELKRCSCVRSCGARCNCKRFDLPCTELCKCDAKCSEIYED